MKLKPSENRTEGGRTVPNEIVLVIAGYRRHESSRIVIKSIYMGKSFVVLVINCALQVVES